MAIRSRCRQKADYQAATLETIGTVTSKADVEVDIQRRLFLTALEPELAKKLSVCARKQGVYGNSH